MKPTIFDVGSVADGRYMKRWESKIAISLGIVILWAIVFMIIATAINPSEGGRIYTLPSGETLVIEASVVEIVTIDGYILSGDNVSQVNPYYGLFVSMAITPLMVWLLGVLVFSWKQALHRRSFTQHWMDNNFELPDD